MSPEDSRRGFIELLGAGGMAILSGSTQWQVEGDTSVSEFDAAGVLVGPAANRPPPDGQYLNSWDTYAFLYIATDAGTKSQITHVDNGWTQIPVDLVSYPSNNLPVSPAGGPGSVFYDTDRDLQALWYGGGYKWPNFTNDVKTTPETVAGDQAETTVFSPNITKNSLISERTYTVDIFGKFSTATSTDQFTLRIKIGGTTVASITSVAENVTDAPFLVKTQFGVETEGQTGNIQSFSHAAFANVNDDQPHGSSSVDTTASTSIEITIDWDGTDATNSLTVFLARFIQMG